MFEEYCATYAQTDSDGLFEGAVLIFMDDLSMQDRKKTHVPVMSNNVKNYFYRNCSEDACKTGDMTSGRVDPVLKLFPGCPMMLTKNKDVLNGQANGSRVCLKKIKFRPGELPMIVELLCGAKIRAFFFSQIFALTVQNEISDITPQEFDIGVKQYYFQAKIAVNNHEGPSTHSMKGHQFPIISNSATSHGWS
jgi:hypothetical protein